MIKSFIMNFFLFFLFIITPSLMSQVYRLDQKKISNLEVGAGIAWGNFTYYAGSKEKRNLVIPFPNFVVRGENIRSDEDGGLRGRFLSTHRFEINSSIALNLPYESDDLEIRKGMNDPGLLMEFGPGFIYHLIPRKKNNRFSLFLSLNTRIAFETNFKSITYRGLVAEPLLYSWTKLSQKVALYTGVSTSWSTKIHQDFYYGVNQKYENSFRKSHNAEGGLFSLEFSNFLIWNVNKRLSLFGGFFYDNFSMSKNRFSPLHEVDSSYSTLLGFTYWFYQKN